MQRAHLRTAQKCNLNGNSARVRVRVCACVSVAPIEFTIYRDVCISSERLCFARAVVYSLFAITFPFIWRNIWAN